MAFYMPSREKSLYLLKRTKWKKLANFCKRMTKNLNHCRLLKFEFDATLWDDSNGLES